MTPEELARTIESRLATDQDLAKTLLKRPRATIEPALHPSANGLAAVDALRRLPGTLDTHLSIVRTLGEGGMGVVHLATQATLGRHVAVKTVRAGQVQADSTLRILREAWVTGSLEHPNIVPVYDVSLDADGAPVIVMKRVEGRPWSELLQDPGALCKISGGADAVEASLRVLLSVCNAIGFAHSRGILHRDIKPENVMIGSFGEVYVLDWGIAVSLREDPSGRLPPLSQAREVAGTPSYMAPEMLLGEPSAISERTDVYLLGAVFYEIFAGEPPHRGANLQQMVASIVVSEPRFADNFPAEARGICERAMRRDPAGRHESVEALRSAIEEYLRHRGSRRLAYDAKQSLTQLLQELEKPASEERALAIFNLLGECRFGYRAALSAWPGNEAARRGLDRALLGVIEHELGEGDAAAAALLLREVSDAPASVVSRVEAAQRAKVEEDERLRRLESDLDPAVGTRTRTLLGSIFGALWTLTPLLAWGYLERGGESSHLFTLLPSASFLALAGIFRLWARTTMTRTLLNRRIGQTLGVHLAVQMLLAAGAMLLDVSPVVSQTLHIAAWALTQSLLAVWVNRWFAACAVVSAASFLLACVRPAWLYPLMVVDNAFLTLILVRVWLPQADLERVREHRRLLRKQAKKIFLDLSRRPGSPDAG